MKFSSSCWAFAAIAALECRKYLIDSNLIVMSEQQLVDCDKASFACDGGYYPYAYNYLAVGSMTSQSYPYTANNGTCKYSSSNVVARTDSYQLVSINTTNDNAIISALVSTGPIPISVYVDSKFQTYKSGIFTNSPPSQTNHAVVIVGYGTENGTDFWIVRNSWGTWWGENGYIRIKRNAGLVYFPVYPNLK